MLRGLLWTVVATNLLFLAWSQGWLAPTAPGPLNAVGEPQRLANQVRPEWIQVLPPKAPPSQPRVVPSEAANAVSSVSTASAADGAWACLEAGPFTSTTATAAEDRLKSAAIPSQQWSRETLTATSSPDAAVNQIWLRVPRADAELQTKLQALPEAELAGGFKRCR